jgi:hypothetical protein
MLRVAIRDTGHETSAQQAPLDGRIFHLFLIKPTHYDDAGDVSPENSSSLG